MLIHRWAHHALFLLALALAACAGSPPAPAPAPAVEVRSAPVAARLEAIARVVAHHREALALPGLSVALVDNGELIWAGGVGLAVIETDAPATSQTVYRTASVSKPLAATLIVRLAAQGKLDLDAPIGDAIADLPEHIRPLTARQILSHTTGMRHYRYEAGEKERAEPFATVDEAIRIYGVLDDPLTFAPGTGYLYSTYAYNLLAALVPAKTGQSFADAMQAEVFTPAGMTSARMAVGEINGLDLAGQYRRAEDGSTTPAPTVDLSWKLPGGGVLASVEDLARYVIALDGTDGALITADANERFGVYRAVVLPDGTDTGYGLGWHVKRDDTGEPWVGHGGGATGGSAYLFRRPANRFAVAVLCNLEIKSAELQAVARAVEAAWRGEAVEIPSPTTPTPPASERQSHTRRAMPNAGSRSPAMP